MEHKLKKKVYLKFLNLSKKKSAAIKTLTRKRLEFSRDVNKINNLWGKSG
jgi:hypothetical protein